MKPGQVHCLAQVSGFFIFKVNFIVSHSFAYHSFFAKESTLTQGCFETTALTSKTSNSGAVLSIFVTKFTGEVQTTVFQALSSIVILQVSQLFTTSQV